MLHLQVLILAIPPVVPASTDRPKAELEHMQQLASAVDGFSLMTYDYSAGAPGPNFPLPWQEQNLKQLAAEASSSKGAKGGVLTKPSAYPPLSSAYMYLWVYAAGGGACCGCAVVSR